MHRVATPSTSRSWRSPARAGWKRFISTSQRMVDALERYVTYLIAERNVSPYTLRNYRTEIGQFIEYAEAHGVKTWDQVDKALVRRWLAELRDAGYVPASITRRMSEVRSCCTFLVREGLLERNVLASMASPKQPRQQPRVLSYDEVLAILRMPDVTKPQGQRDLAILEVFYGSGIRLGGFRLLQPGTREPGGARGSGAGKGQQRASRPVRQRRSNAALVPSARPAQAGQRQIGQRLVSEPLWPTPATREHYSLARPLCQTGWH